MKRIAIAIFAEKLVRKFSTGSVCGDFRLFSRLLLIVFFNCGLNALKLYPVSQFRNNWEIEV